MKNISSAILLLMIALGVLLFSAVCWHSVDEIHYLKSFFPKRFSVEEAYYAASIELIKVVIIGLPIVVFVGVSLYLLTHRDR